MNGIDTSGCEYFCVFDKEGMCGIENARYEKCAENNSCEYKQIQRLKVENSKLKDEIICLRAEIEKQKERYEKRQKCLQEEKELYQSLNGQKRQMLLKYSVLLQEELNKNEKFKDEIAHLRQEGKKSCAYCEDIVKLEKQIASMEVDYKTRK